LTSEGVRWLGRPYYMAPEQVLGMRTTYQARTFKRSEEHGDAKKKDAKRQRETERLGAKPYAISARYGPRSTAIQIPNVKMRRETNDAEKLVGSSPALGRKFA